jgi:hypothetical protein
MAVLYPVIGQWFRRPNGVLFEVVAIDEAEGTVEIQLFDGTIDEVDLENWPELLLTEVSAPEDWTGSVDMDPDEPRDRTEADIPNGYHDPWQFLDNS